MTRESCKWIFFGTVVLVATLQRIAVADSPEMSMRDFASNQIKKGVRSLGLGGDGATWGNYALVWRDAGTAIADYGDTSYSNGNDFHFVALGATSPSLWHKLAFYLVALNQDTNQLRFNLKSPGLGPGATPTSGNGADHALFSKIALPLGHGFSAGVLLSYETSHFFGHSISAPQNTVRYETSWRPSGGFGLAWQPDRRWLFGVRVLLNNDDEQRTDSHGVAQGLARSNEVRLGGSVSLWEGALFDVGGTRLHKQNAIARTQSLAYQPNIGFEQALFRRRLSLRFGVDETSPTAGLSARWGAFNVDLAYVRNLGRARGVELFGARSDSIIATFTLDYEALGKKH
jgi:hypothetical protein